MARTLTLQLLATMPSLIVQDSVVQQHIVNRISAEDRDERSAALEAAHAFLLLSTLLRRDVLTLALESNSATLCCLVADAVSTSAEARRAWTHCAELYERLADDKSAVANVRAMTTLTAAYPGVLLSMHGQLLHHVLDHDPRAVLRNFALLATQQLVSSSGEYGQIGTVLEGEFSRVGDTVAGRTEMRLKLSALLLLEKFSSIGQDLGENAEALLKMAKTWLSAAVDERFGKNVYIDHRIRCPPEASAGWNDIIRARYS